MAKLATIARRTFMVGAAAVAGGLVVGTIVFRRDPTNPLLVDLPDGASALNPYVLIDAKGITLITPRGDKGQGTVSVQAALIAEELDVAWGQFKTDFGPPSAAYYNGTVLAEGFPIRATSDSFAARLGRGAGDVMGKLMGFQITGGSSTVSDGFDKLRVAGATARQMLLQAAAQRSGVSVDKLKTQDGAVILPDGKSLSYASLAAEAAKVSPPSDVALKPRAQWRLLGKPMQRLDIVAKSTGTMTFGIDVRLPGMLHATVRTNPRAGSRTMTIDSTEAAASKGVVKVVTLSDGVAVIANNTWRAFQAASKLMLTWGAPAQAGLPSNTESMFAAVAASIDEAHRDSRLRDDGDVDGAIKEAGDKMLQAEYRVPFLAHAPMEPMNAVVQLKDGRLDIWTGTQIPRFVVKTAARVSGLHETQIHLHAQMMGGSFGRRLEDDYVRQAVEIAKAHPGVPIKMTWSREEDMTHDWPRPLAVGRLRGAVKNGQVHAFDLALASPSVTASQVGRLGMPVAGPDTAIVAGAWDQPFAIPHHRVTGYRAAEMVGVSSWRSVGASGNGFIHQCALDELILAAGADPLAERLRLCDHEPSKRVLEAVGAMANWATPLPKGRGRGLAFTMSFGVPTAEVVEVTATSAGIRIDAVYVACEVGRVIDPVNFEAQVQGGVIWGLGHAMFAELTYVDGVVQQTNFHAYGSMNLAQTPRIVVKALETTEAIKGIGEPPVPPAAAALANAIFAATGKRIRELPLQRQVNFV